MRTSIWLAAEDEINQDLWIMQGPWIDAEHEETLEDAIAHCESCCDCVVADTEDYDTTEYIALARDLDFLNCLLSYMPEDHKWYKQVKELELVATLAEAA